jgi:malate dehydrogenase (oxaloacetate-decarboxylating)(NADP+)
MDVLSRRINEEMKMAAVRALASLAKQDVPESVSRAYKGERFRFGKEYLIPKPFDRRVLLWVAPAVAQAAMDSGVARVKVDLNTYRERLETHLGSIYTVMRSLKRRVQAGSKQLPRLVLPEGEHYKIIKAAGQMVEEGIATPILLGDEEKIRARIAELELGEMLKGVQIIRPSKSPLRETFAKAMFDKRHRKGITPQIADALMKQANYFGAMMVETGHADGLLNGMTQSYAETLKPAIRVIGVKPGSRLAGIYMFIFKKRVLWLADTTVNIDPTAEQLADIAIQTATLAKSFLVSEPKVAMLSFSNF